MQRSNRAALRAGDAYASESMAEDNPDVVRRQEDALEALEALVESYIAGVDTPQTREGREKLAGGLEVLRALWLELDAQTGVFRSHDYPALQLCRAAANLFSKPEDDLAAQLLQLGGQSTLAPLLRLCGRPEHAGAAEKGSELRHYASTLLYRLLPSETGMEWITDNASQVDVITAMFGDTEEAGSVREHAAAVLLALSHTAHLRERLTQPMAVGAYISTFKAGDTQGNAEYSTTLRRYAGTILADLSSAPSLHRHVAQDPAHTFPAVLSMLEYSAAFDAQSTQRAAASILSNLSQVAELQPLLIQYGALEPLIAACGDDVREPKDPKLQLLALFTLANISSNQECHSLLCEGDLPWPLPRTGSSRPGTAGLMQSPPAAVSTPPILRVVLPLMEEDVRPQTQRQRYAFAILTRLARSPSNQEVIGSHVSILRRILIVMTRAEAEPAAARQAVSLLSVLSVNPWNQIRIAKVRLPKPGIVLGETPSNEDETKRGACNLLVQMLKTDDIALAKCAACAITNVAANVDAHAELFACTELVSTLFKQIKRKDLSARFDRTLQQYACDALSNLALGSHRRPPTRDEDDTAARAAADTATATTTRENKVEFPSPSDCLAMCQLIPLQEEDEEEQARVSVPTSGDESCVPMHVLSMLSSGGHCEPVDHWLCIALADRRTCRTI